MQIRFIDSIHKVDQSSWNQLCQSDYPFSRHEFLATLEDAHCTVSEAGWQVDHLVVYEQGQLVAAMPGYIKNHSYGEYVFDWAWADAYRRYGVEYYPKWISAIPFTPCAGPRLFSKRDINTMLPAIHDALQQHCASYGLSGWHCLFPLSEQSEAFSAAGTLQRVGCQFHWFNYQYRTFDDFVARMASRKRKNILKERREVKANGFRFEIKEKDALVAEDMEVFYRLYRNTYLKRSGHQGYLTREFFQRLLDNCRNNLVLICALAQQEKAVIAAALFLRDQDTLYGRYWGCFEEYQFLHFETCYYQGIDYAIARQLQRFDGGAQGEHKIARGFEPRLTYSNHQLQDPRFQSAVAHFVQQETPRIQQYLVEACTLLPFKNDSAP